MNLPIFNTSVLAKKNTLTTLLHRTIRHVFSPKRFYTLRPPSDTSLYPVHRVPRPRTSSSRPTYPTSSFVSYPLSFDDIILPAPTSPDNSHLPLNFGAEFEVIIRPKDIASLAPDLSLPNFDASHRQRRDFNLNLLHVVSKVLSDSGLACKVFTTDEDDESKPDYSRWHITMDASLSKKHIADGFYPVEIVTPVVKADVTWKALIDQFWSIIHKHFDLRRDTSCGMHIHVSPAQGRFDIDQLRSIAKAVVLWERDTARCAPLSRDDQVQNFCLSNVRGGVPAARSIHTHGPIRGLRHAFSHINHASRNDIVHYVCPDKHRARNFLPTRDNGHGSVEFRRPPGVVTSKKAKHWIAFTMAFVDMALRSDLDFIARRLSKHHLQRRNNDMTSRSSLTFDDLLLASAEHLGIYSTLDPRLRQLDEPRSLHITMMRPDRINWLQRLDDDYHLSTNA